MSGDAVSGRSASDESSSDGFADSLSDLMSADWFSDEIEDVDPSDWWGDAAQIWGEDDGDVNADGDAAPGLDFSG